MKEIIDVTGKLVIDYRAREWCKLPYHNHPNGCPNYGNREDCPPKAEKVENYFNLTLPHWLAIVDFDLESHKNKMKIIHPDWSDYQLKCVLYWQGGVRKKLKELCEDFIFENITENIEYRTCPEAMGVHVISTMKKLGYKISKNIKNTVYKVTLIGYPNEKICS